MREWTESAPRGVVPTKRRQKGGIDFDASVYLFVALCALSAIVVAYSLAFVASANVIITKFCYIISIFSIDMYTVMTVVCGFAVIWFGSVFAEFSLGGSTKRDGPSETLKRHITFFLCVRTQIIWREFSIPYLHIEYLDLCWGIIITVMRKVNNIYIEGFNKTIYFKAYIQFYLLWYL